MSSSTALVDRYIAAWNEKDSDRRRQAVKDIWAPDALYANTGQEFRGHEGVETAVREAYEEFGAKGFVFRLNDYAQNHGALRITWDMVPAAGGPVAARGTEYLILDLDGLVSTDHQFPEALPASP
ncbi:nuclear transport factor 2 family protein [Streptomyces anulatus]|uniref:nuclear transport factor 2 family protein n=1 Tax=Streptomyces anulatus TaxID=1892 RepID=UPI002E12670A|nr:nuclear transport factor 2 family protein [Streptomyces anulatus]